MIPDANIELSGVLRSGDAVALERFASKHSVENIDDFAIIPGNTPLTYLLGPSLAQLPEGAIVECADLLCQYGGTIERRHLRLCVMLKRPLVLAHLLSKKPNCWDAQAMQELLLMCCNNCLRLLCSVLQYVDDVNMPILSPSGSMRLRPIHVAAYHGRYDNVCMLLQHGANPWVGDAFEPKCDQATLRFAKIGWNAGHRTSAVIQLLESLQNAKDDFELRKDSLHKELVEAVYHPVRLLRRGCFHDFDQNCDLDILVL
jgi:hypothetical protein